MRRYLKMWGKKCKFAVFAVAILFLSLFFCLDVSADYYSCLYSSGGREDIDSVQWACGKNPPACSLWIGGSGGQSSTFYVESSSGTVTAYMWGMCTGHAIAAVNVSISNDNDSFYDNSWGMSVYRGNWGAPASTPISVDIGRFISGITPYTTYDGYKAYSRNVNIYRCNGENPSSCSSQYSLVTIVVKEKPGYDVPEDRREIREGVRYESFNINGSSQVASVLGGKQNNNGIYELTDESAKVNFEHKLWHTSYLFSPAVSYYTDGVSGTTNISADNNVTVNNYKNSMAKLGVHDELEDVCQNIKYWSKTWTYGYNREFLVKYNVHYDGYGREIGRDKISETPIGAEFLDENYLVGSNDGASTDACVSLHRPWNFKVASIDNNTKSDEIVYVGDTLSPSFTVNIVKNNNDFAITDIPRAGIMLCYGLKSNEICKDTYNGKTIRTDGKIVDDNNYTYRNSDGYSVLISDEGVTIDDLPAGSEYCVVFKITPSDSGNGYYSGFNRNAMVSEKCYKIAKRPTVQVWGGNVVSGGSISAGMTKKKDKMFGSWGELAVIGDGVITGFAGGASLANGGSLDSKKLVSLNFANDEVGSSRLGGNFKVNVENINKDKDAIIAKIEASEPTDVLPDGPVSGQIYIKKSGDLLIDKNILYANELIDLENMPKVLIYAAGDIKIRCDVSEIDAILVADGIVDTCVDEKGENPGQDEKARSNQLRINGMIIAKELRLNRTYGAAAGDYSDVPAEIINYDPLIELMPIKKDDGRITGLNSVYLHELAPRY